MQQALTMLIGVPCVTRIEALALRAHLGWWLAEEAPIADGWQPLYGTVEARAYELSMLLNRGVP